MRCSTRKKRTRLLAQRRRHVALVGEVYLPHPERGGLPLTVAGPPAPSPEASPSAGDLPT